MEVAEQYMMFLIASMTMIEKYDFIDKLLEKVGGLDVNTLPVSNNFKANFWRFSALCQLKNDRNANKSDLK